MYSALLLHLIDYPVRPPRCANSAAGTFPSGTSTSSIRWRTVERIPGSQLRHRTGRWSPAKSTLRERADVRQAYPASRLVARRCNRQRTQRRWRIG
jgi:hypothetical protein